MLVLPLYRNQSIDLQRKSIDWFLYEGNIGNEWVNHSFNSFEIKFSDQKILSG